MAPSPYPEVGYRCCLKKDPQCILTVTFRFPQNNKTNGRGKKGRGIGSHTDYGLLVIAAQDEVGGEIPVVSLGVHLH